MKENKFHSIPYRFPNSLMIHNRHPWCHSPCRKGSYSRPPRRHHSSSSRLPTSRSHRKLVPGQYCRGSGIHRTSTPGCSGHNNLHFQLWGDSMGEKKKHKITSSVNCIITDQTYNPNECSLRSFFPWAASSQTSWGKSLNKSSSVVNTALVKNKRSCAHVFNIFTLTLHDSPWLWVPLFYVSYLPFLESTALSITGLK